MKQETLEKGMLLKSQMELIQKKSDTLIGGEKDIARVMINMHSEGEFSTAELYGEESVAYLDGLKTSLASEIMNEHIILKQKAAKLLEAELKRLAAELANLQD